MQCSFSLGHIIRLCVFYSATHLESIASHLSPPLATQVSHALKQPIRKGLPRLEARHYFSFYQEDPSHDKVLLNFAKLDFNLLQKKHQKKVSDIARLVIKPCHSCKCELFVISYYMHDSIKLYL